MKWNNLKTLQGCLQVVTIVRVICVKDLLPM